MDANPLPPDGRLRAPRRPLPPLSVDCHAHIFDRFERYPFAGNRKYQPPLCTRESWLGLHAALGVERGVQVHGSAYGFDNSITEDFLTEQPGRLRAVGAIAPDADPGLLKRLHAAGFRAARLMDQFATAATTADLEAVAARVAPLGWHIEINITRSSDWSDLESRLMACPVPIVFDHMGRTRGSEGIDAPGFRVIRRVLEKRPDCATKISSWYRLSDAGPPYYDDMRPFAQVLLTDFPRQCVWGSNWPHPGIHKDMPNDIDLVDLLDSWLPDEAVREPLFASNAARLYQFGA